MNKSIKPQATPQEIQELFIYDPSNMTFPLVWRVDRVANKTKGARAGTLHPNGYVYVQIDGKLERLHRVVFCLLSGYWPNIINHLDHNTQNNLIENLEDTDSQGNARDITWAPNKSGYPGVYWHKTSQKWRACIWNNNKKQECKHFKTPETAYLWYVRRGWQLGGYSDKHLMPTREHELIVVRNLINN